MNTFEEYERAALDTAVYPGQGTALGLMYVALKMNGEAGELAEHVGKAVRDDALLAHTMSYSKRTEATPDVFCQGGELAPDRRALLRKEVGDVLWYLAATARELGTTLSEIALGNIAKLADRKARGALGGSGDER